MRSTRKLCGTFKKNKINVDKIGKNAVYFILFLKKEH